MWLTITNRCWKGDNTVHGGHTVQNTDIIGEIIQNRQIVFDDNDVGLRGNQWSNDTSSVQSLLDIQVGRRFVKHVYIRFLYSDNTDCETLKLTTRQLTDFTLQDALQLCILKIISHRGIESKCYRSKLDWLPNSLHISSKLSRSSLSCKSWPTWPFTTLGIWSTYCGFMMAFKSSSKIFVK